MRRLSYQIALILCTASASYAWLGWLGIPLLQHGFWGTFSQPLPLTAQLLLPRTMTIAVAMVFLSLVFLLLLWRRVLISVKARAWVIPSEMMRWPGWFLVMSVVFVFLGISALIVTVVIAKSSSGGVSGVPAGLLFLPAMNFLTPSLFYIELLSFLKSWKTRNHPKKRVS